LATKNIEALTTSRVVWHSPMIVIWPVLLASLFSSSMEAQTAKPTPPLVTTPSFLDDPDTSAPAAGNIAKQLEEQHKKNQEALKPLSPPSSYANALDKHASATQTAANGSGQWTSCWCSVTISRPYVWTGEITFLAQPFQSERGTEEASRKALQDYIVKKYGRDAMNPSTVCLGGWKSPEEIHESDAKSFAGAHIAHISWPSGGSDDSSVVLQNLAKQSAGTPEKNANMCLGPQNHPDGKNCVIAGR
jgi:hypothetical protein